MSNDDLTSKVLEAAGWSPLRKALHASRGGPAVRIVEFDGSGGRLRGVPLALRTLTSDESVRLRAQAVTFLRDRCGFSEDYLIGTTDGTSITEFEVKVRTLALALVEPAPPHRQLAKDADDLREMFEVDEVSGLFESFIDFVQERSPITSAQSPEEVGALCDALGKGMLPFARLNVCDSASLRSIARELATRLRALTSAPSSPTQPSSDTATDTSEPSE